MTSARGLSRFFAAPPTSRLALLVGFGIVVCVATVGYRRAQRPETVPPDAAATGLAETRQVLERVRQSAFGQSERGALLTRRATRFLEDHRIQFSTTLRTEAYFRKEPFCAPLLYIGVYDTSRGVAFPTQGEMAERIFHETLHAIKQSRTQIVEEECDAYCAAEEARAAVEQRAPAFPIKRDGQFLWLWVREVYTNAITDPHYQPVGQTIRDLALKTGRLPSESTD